MKLLKLAIVVCIIGTCSGCATYGNPRIGEDSLVSQIKENYSTTRDVKSLLGEPEETSLSPSGDVIWEYSYFVQTIGRYQGKNLNIHFDRKTDIVKFIGKGGDSGGLLR